jgi:hypothetical protein
MSGRSHSRLPLLIAALTCACANDQPPPQAIDLCQY